MNPLIGFYGFSLPETDNRLKLYETSSDPVSVSYPGVAIPYQESGHDCSSGDRDEINRLADQTGFLESKSLN